MTGPAGDKAERLLVCVGPSPLSAPVIRTAHRVAARLHAEWTAVTVETPELSQAPDPVRDRLLEHLRLAAKLGATTRSLAGTSIADAVLEYARENHISMIVIGKPTHPRWKDFLRGSPVDELIRKSGALEIHVVKGETSDLEEPTPASRGGVKSLLLEALIALSVAAACGGLAKLAAPFITESDKVMIFMAGVVLVAYRASLRTSALTALAVVATFNFFFVSPMWTFGVDEARYLLTFFAMASLGLLVSSLVGRARGQALAAEQRQRTNARLFDVTRHLVGAESVDEICRIARREFSAIFTGDVAIFVADGEELRLAASAGAPLDGAEERAAADSAFREGAKAGRGTSTFPNVAGHYLPMVTTTGTVGVVGLRLGDRGALDDPQQRDLLENMVFQFTQALERAMLSEEKYRAELNLETERLRNSLLSSISHDLRTPVASIAGNAELLQDRALILDDERRRLLLESVGTEANRLQLLLVNLLEMTRIEGGGLQLHPDWHPVDEIVGGALSRQDLLLSERPVKIQVIAELIFIDETSITTALANLVENAVKYSPEGSPIEIRCHREANDDVVFEVLDRGVGVDPTQGQAIFEKFHRGAHSEGVVGSGLGLAIVRAVVHAHGGEVFARRREDGRGSNIGFRLDQSRAPAAPTMHLESEMRHG